MAVEDALAKGRDLADAAGVRLGVITLIDDRGATQSGDLQLGVRTMAPSAALHVEAGTSSVTARVTITVQIQD